MIIKNNDINFGEYAKRTKLHLKDLLVLFEGQLRQGMDSMYEISESEITFKTPVNDAAFNLLDPYEQTVLLEAQDELTLALPCTPEQLTDWVDETCRDFALPKSFTNKSGGKSKENSIAADDKEKALQQWLEGLMENNSEKKTKGDCKFEAIEKYGSIPIRMFDRAWDNAIDTTGNTKWKRAGRPKKKPSE